MRLKTLAAAGLTTILLAGTPQVLNEPEAFVLNGLEGAMIAAGKIEDMIKKSVRITLAAIDEAELRDKYRNTPSMRTASNPRGPAASTAWHPHGPTESTIEIYYQPKFNSKGDYKVLTLERDGKPVVLEEDYKLMKPIYERMDYRHKKRGDLDYHIDYGEEIILTKEEKTAYERTCERIIEYMLFQNKFDIKDTILEWRLGRGEVIRLSEKGRDPTRADPKYFEAAFNYFANNYSRI
ncbi:MAG: hypothetical protein ABH849_01320 [Nanoarchaeota archaeon]